MHLMKFLNHLHMNSVQNVLHKSKHFDSMFPKLFGVPSQSLHILWLFPERCNNMLRQKVKCTKMYPGFQKPGIIQDVAGQFQHVTAFYTPWHVFLQPALYWKCYRNSILPFTGAEIEKGSLQIHYDLSTVTNR